MSQCHERPKFTCQSHRLCFFAEIRAGSSRGRGNRAAAWFADYIDDKADRYMQSLVLDGGIKGWVNEKGEYLQHMQDYDESQW